MADHVEPFAYSLVKSEIPLSRMIRGATNLQSIMLSNLASHHRDDQQRFQQHSQLAQEYFSKFMFAFSRAYERNRDRLERAAELKHDEFLENMIFPAFLLDLEGRFQTVNAAMSEFLKVDRGQLIGKHITALLCNEDVCRMDFQKYWSTLRTKRRVDRFPVTIMCCDRGDLNIEISSTYRKNLDGEWDGIQGFIQNVTLRKQQEKLITEQQKTLEAIIENAPVGLYFLDRDGIIQRINRRFFKNQGEDPDLRDNTVGKHLGQQIKKSANKYKHPEKIIAFVEKMLGDKNVSGREEFEMANGRTNLIISTPVRGDDGELIGRIAINADLTQQRELEGLRDSLTQMIVHDLKNPLTAISMSGNVLESLLQKEPNKNVEQTLAVIKRNSDTMMRMILNLLDISRIEENKMVLKKEKIDFYELIEELAPTLKTIASQHTVALPRKRKLRKIELDPGVVRRVIENLFGNAAKHTRKGGKVSLGLSTANKKYLQISVRDNGEGIAEEDSEAIYEKFGQAASRRRGKKNRHRSWIDLLQTCHRSARGKHQAKKQTRRRLDFYHQSALQTINCWFWDLGLWSWGAAKTWLIFFHNKFAEKCTYISRLGTNYALFLPPGEQFSIVFHLQYTSS